MMSVSEGRTFLFLYDGKIDCSNRFVNQIYLFFLFIETIEFEDASAMTYLPLTLADNLVYEKDYKTKNLISFCIFIVHIMI